MSWWNQGLAVKSRKVRKLFNAAKKSGDWTDYKRTVTDYNKALRQAKRESGRRHCEEIEKAPECARLHRILSKDEQSAICSIQLENGDYTTTEKQTLEELFRVHFPGSEIVSETGTVLNWSFQNGKDPGRTGRCPKGPLVTIN